MYCLTVTYTKGDDTHFDADYYLNTHIPLCADKFGPYGFQGHVLRMAPADAPGGDAHAYAVIDLVFDSAESLGKALEAVGKPVTDDVANYTNVAPKMEFAEFSGTFN